MINALLGPRVETADIEKHISFLICYSCCMSASIACPQCDNLVDSQARYCGYCGVDLAIAAVLAERSVGKLDEISGGLLLTPEILVPRLGSYLIEKGVLDTQGLDRALVYQEEQSNAGNPILLGQALRELGLVDPETLDQAITTQILQLQSALQQANRQLEARVQERTIELQKAIEKLTELNQLKANFIANISHELRTPLTHMKGYLDLLYEGTLGPLNRSQTEALAVLTRAEERLESLIEDLIQYSLADRGELNLIISPTDVNRLIKSTVDQSLSKAEKKRIQMDIHVPTGLPRVLCDGDKVGWVLLQFLDNAIKFTPVAGNVRIEASSRDNRVTIMVEDTGIGIPEDRLPEIFEPFHQLDGSTTRRYGGTGLGLALSNRIMAAHDVKINVNSHVNEGSCFQFSLPIAPDNLEKGHSNV
jgi:signal transduction histidine kinase